MTEMFATLGTWNWLIFGFVVMALELLAPGVFLFWFGLAAGMEVGELQGGEAPAFQQRDGERIGDTVWRVAGPDTPAGTRVKVVQVDGANLTVAAA